MATLKPESSSPERHVFLVGRPPIGQFIAFIQVRAVGGQDADVSHLAEEWREANDRIRELKDQEPEWADSPEIRPIPDELSTLAGELKKDPVYQKAFRLLPARVGMVDLDRLVVFQKHINLDYVEELREQLSDEPDEEEVFEFCLPAEPSQPPVQLQQIGRHAFTFVSLSDDFRFLGTDLVDPEQVSGHGVSGRPVKFLVSAVGYGSNYLNAFRFKNRLVLNNGSHRAYALREIGVTSIPCVIRDMTREEEREVLPDQVVQSMDMYFEEPRPPVLKDYFDSELRKIVEVNPKRRAVQLQVRTKKQDAPA